MSTGGHQGESPEGALTSQAYWDDRWAAIRLPYVIDPRVHWWGSFVALFERVLWPEPATVLEVGSGACEWLIHFEDRYQARTFGLDYSAVGCRVGAENLRLAGQTPRIVRGDIGALPLQERAFDLVFSAGVIEHFETYADLVGDLARLVRPGGQLLTTVPNFAGWVGVARRWQEPESRDIHLRLRERDLRAAYESAGLAEVEVGHFAALRIPYQALPRVEGLRSGVRAGGVLALKAFDKALVNLYALTGRSIESAWLSSGLYAIGRRR